MIRLRMLAAGSVVMAVTVAAAPAAYPKELPAQVSAGVGAAAPPGYTKPRPAPRERVPRTVTTLPKSVAAVTGWGATGIDTFDNRQLLLVWNDVFWGAEPPPMGFTGDLATCVPGTTSADYRLAELETINALRGIAGVGPLTEDPTWSALAQQGALPVARMGGFDSPTPYPPPGTGCLTPTAETALSRGVWMNKAGPQGINWYVEDYNNIASMNLRSMALSAGATTVGFGDAPDANVTVLKPTPGASLLVGASRSGFVAWPNAGRVPVWLADYWAFLDAFSVELSTANEHMWNSTVAITSAGQPIGLTYAVPAAATRFTFMPARAPMVGETWKVTVSNVTNTSTSATRSFSYDIQFVGNTFGTPLVVAAYQDFLGRSPGQSEIDFQSGALWNGQVTREGFLRSLANSNEWLAQIVRRMYLDTLGREPDPAGLATWVDWIRTGRFTVAQAASLFYSSQEFYQGLGGNDLTSWVTKLYEKLLNRSPDPAGLSAWVAYAANPAYGRSWVAGQFYQSLESRLTRVRNLYQSVLGRNPDPTGWPFWAEVILAKGDIELAVSLAASQEYFLRSWDRYL